MGDSADDHTSNGSINSLNSGVVSAKPDSSDSRVLSKEYSGITIKPRDTDDTGQENRKSRSTRSLKRSTSKKKVKNEPEEEYNNGDNDGGKDSGDEEVSFSPRVTKQSIKKSRGRKSHHRRASSHSSVDESTTKGHRSQSSVDDSDERQRDKYSNDYAGTNGDMNSSRNKDNTTGDNSNRSKERSKTKEPSLPSISEEKRSTKEIDSNSDNMKQKQRQQSPRNNDIVGEDQSGANDAKIEGEKVDPVEFTSIDLTGLHSSPFIFLVSNTNANVPLSSFKQIIISLFVG